jgi:hypothetical protein
MVHGIVVRNKHKSGVSFWKRDTRDTAETRDTADTADTHDTADTPWFKGSLLY